MDTEVEALSHQVFETLTGVDYFKDGILYFRCRFEFHGLAQRQLVRVATFMDEYAPSQKTNPFYKEGKQAFFLQYISPAFVFLLQI
jgi:hypothetical protein